MPRDDEVSAAVEALQNARALLITGGPGVGKNTIAHEAIRRYLGASSAAVIIVRPGFLLEGSNVYLTLARALYDRLVDDATEGRIELAEPDQDTLADVGSFSRYAHYVARQFPDHRFIFFCPSFHAVVENDLSQRHDQDELVTELFRAFACLQGFGDWSEPWTVRYASVICGRLHRGFYIRPLKDSAYKPREVLVPPLNLEQTESLLQKAWGVPWENCAKQLDVLRFIYNQTFGIPALVQALGETLADACGEHVTLGACEQAAKSFALPQGRGYDTSVARFLQDVDRETKEQSVRNGRFLLPNKPQYEKQQTCGREDLILKPGAGPSSGFISSCVIIERTIMTCIHMTSATGANSWQEEATRGSPAGVLDEPTADTTETGEGLPVPHDLSQLEKTVLDFLGSRSARVSQAELFQRTRDPQLPRVLNLLVKDGLIRETQRRFRRTTLRYYQVSAVGKTT